MQLRQEVNESYIQKQKKMVEKMKVKNEQLEKEALAKTEESESERCWMNRAELCAQTGGFLYLPSKGGGGYDYLAMQEVQNFLPEAANSKKRLRA